MTRWIAGMACLLALLTAGSASAASLQQVGTFRSPMYVTSDPRNPDRLFVVEREGLIKQVQGGVVSPFADLTPVVGCELEVKEGCLGERGLQTIALSPDFEVSGRFFVDYTDAAGDIRVAEMRATGATAALSSLRELLKIPHPEDTNHIGGQLQFGPEGLLYISTGDGGGVDDAHKNAQSISSLLGKILRLDPNPSGALPYTVPAGNPFGGAGAPIWSLGLRNPYRFSFDRGTGAIWIGDVGQSAREEVDYAAPGAPGGANYGWNCREGLLAGPATDPECASPVTPFVNPVFDYAHLDRGGGTSPCAIIGGYVVRDSNLPSLYGRYLYSDLCEGTLRSFDPASPATTDRVEPVSGGGIEPISFGQDSCGRILIVNGAASGAVYRLVGTSAGCPPEAAAADDRAASLLAIKALAGRRVERGKRAQLVSWVAPCKGRRGQAVSLYRGRVKVQTRLLNRVCSVRFRPKISRRGKYRATIGGDSDYLSAVSRTLKIKVAKHKKQKRKRVAEKSGRQPG